MERAVEDDAGDVAPVLERHFFDVLLLAERCVVDEIIDAAEFFDRQPDQCTYLFLDHHIGRAEHAVGAKFPGQCFALGHAAAGGTGSKAVLEVRSHEVPFVLEDGQKVGRLIYERLTEPPEAVYGQKSGAHYQAQGLQLSKHFKRSPRA